jgi:hypothetical protein
MPANTSRLPDVESVYTSVLVAAGLLMALCAGYVVLRLFRGQA